MDTYTLFSVNQGYIWTLGSGKGVYREMKIIGSPAVVAIELGEITVLRGHG